MNVDHAAVEAMRRNEAARAVAERIEVLRHIVFHNAARGNREIEDLTQEPEAARLLIRASASADGRMVLGILRVAIDNRWGDVVKAGARHFGEHPVAERIHELWTLTKDRAAV
jgi:hypothetical protein